jgi:hypothetical protein
LSYIATISRFPDGRLGEIFLSDHKAGSRLILPRVVGRAARRPPGYAGRAERRSPAACASGRGRGGVMIVKSGTRWEVANDSPAS